MLTGAAALADEATARRSDRTAAREFRDRIARPTPPSPGTAGPAGWPMGCSGPSDTTATPADSGDDDEP